jgi:LCP family protein required for cell wall assembly
VTTTGLDERPYRDTSGRRGGGGEVSATEQGGAKARNPKSAWYLKFVIILGSILIVVSLGTLGLVYGLSSRYDSKAQHDDLLGGLPRNQTNTSDGPLNYLVLGTDSRDKTEKQAADSTGANSDTILLVHVTKGLKSAFIVSIPRDSYVDIPAGGNWKGGKDKVNAAFSHGGAKLAAQTIYNLTKIPLNGAMIINFAGVVNMVNAVGGVHVCVPYDVPNFFADFPQYKNGWAKGCHDMQGEEAEVFMRQRHDVPGGDFGRIRSQQLVMKALAQKATSAGVLVNPGKMDALLSTAAASLTIDKSMNLRDLAFALKGIQPDNITFATAPYKGTMSINGVSYDDLNLPECQILFKAVIDDKTSEWLAAHPQPNVASYTPGDGSQPG